jgi:hypothetical protein
MSRQQSRRQSYDEDMAFLAMTIGLSPEDAAKVAEEAIPQLDEMATIDPDTLSRNERKYGVLIGTLQDHVLALQAKEKSLESKVQRQASDGGGDGEAVDVATRAREGAKGGKQEDPAAGGRGGAHQHGEGNAAGAMR